LLNNFIFRAFQESIWVLIHILSITPLFAEWLGDVQDAVEESDNIAFGNELISQFEFAANLVGSSGFNSWWRPRPTLAV
jgi:hypothetical protein